MGTAKNCYNIEMKTPKFTNIAIFALFFGIALIEALEKQNWLEAALFLALGVMSLWADLRKNKDLPS